MDTLFLKRVSLKKGAHLDRSGYLYRIPTLRGFRSLVFSSPVTFFTGENGAGKSTLLEAVAVALGFNPEGGSRNFLFHSRDTHSALWSMLELVRGPYRPRDGYFVRAESFYNLATNIDDLDGTPACSPLLIRSYGGKSLHGQSHGESFLALFLNRFGGRGLYLLDEPEAALSPSKQLALLCRMNELVRDGSQFIIATHSPLLMAFPGADILLFGEDIRPVAYRETEHYLLTRRFLNDPEGMLRALFQDEAPSGPGGTDQDQRF